MNLDEDLSFGEAFSSPKALKHQLVEITRHIDHRFSKDPNKAESSVQFLAITTKSPDLKRKFRRDKEQSDSTHNGDGGHVEDDDDDLDDDSEGSEGSFMLDDNEDKSRPSYLRPAGFEKSQRPPFWTRRFTPEDATDPNLTLTLVKKPEVSHSQTHVAVSYCWASSFHTARVNEYLPVKMMDLDGRSRPSRASGKVIRRAVRHAAAQGLMFIWIDQECIEQDDRVKKEAAVRKMDLIYRSGNVASLLDIGLDNDSFFDLISLLRFQPDYADDAYIRLLDTARWKNIACQLKIVLDQISTNPWFTRAWITQERLASSDESGNDTLWLMCTAKGNGKKLDGEIGLHVEAMKVLVKDVIGHLDTADVSTILGLRSALDKVVTAFKIPQDMLQVRYIADAVRSRYNVLRAFKMLAGQSCSIPADKTALIANCALWERGLKTYDVETNKWSYSACVWALAIANGDASFFCQDAGCHDQEKSMRMLWAPSSTTRLDRLHCSDHVNGVVMSITDAGLRTKGWLWMKTEFVELKSLQQEFSGRETVNQDDSRDSETSNWQLFFWSLLRELTILKNHGIAELVWRAIKCRLVGGFYGRHVFSVADVPFSKIRDPDTADYIATVEGLGFANRTEYFYRDWFKTDFKNLVYHRKCDRSAKTEAEHSKCDLHKEENFNVLLGDRGQLAGLAWIYDTVLQNGGFSVAVYRDEESESRNHWVAITDSLQDNHVFAQHRQVRICRDGDRKDKKILNPDPFDVWLWPGSRKSHLDRPLCWSAKSQDERDAGSQVVATTKCNVLFDISKVQPKEYVLAWPEEFERDSW